MNKKIGLAVLTSLVLVTVLTIELTQTQNQASGEITPFPSREKVISVTGEATTSVDPNLLVVRFGVETEAKTASEALTQNSVIMNAVVDEIKNLGITEDELSTSSLNIFPIYDSIRDPITGQYKSELKGYRVSNILTVETTNLDMAADIIDAAVVAGANRVDSVSFTLSPEKLIQVKDSLLEEAVLNAKYKAEKALTPLGHQIIGVKAISLSEFGIPPPTPIFRSFDMAESAIAQSATPVFASEQDVRTTANVIFLIGSQ